MSRVLVVKHFRQSPSTYKSSIRLKAVLKAVNVSVEIHACISTCYRGTFARNTVLRVLHMDHNQLRRLDSNSFRGMRFIRRLYFSDNNITDVGRGTFGSVTRVGTVDLARNFIKKIDFQMFSQLQYVEVPNSVQVSLFLFLLLYFH